MRVITSLTFRVEATRDAGDGRLEDLILSGAIVRRRPADVKNQRARPGWSCTKM
jgi:hypothetical protein